MDEFWRIHDGAVTEFDGTLEDYHRQLHKQGGTAVVEEQQKQRVAGVDRKAQRQQSAQLRQSLSPLRKRASELEKKIANKQKKLVDIEQVLADPMLYDVEQKSRLHSALEEQGALRSQMSDLEKEWFDLQEKLEAVNEE